MTREIIKNKLVFMWKGNRGSWGRPTLTEFTWTDWEKAIKIFSQNNRTEIRKRDLLNTNQERQSSHSNVQITQSTTFDNRGIRESQWGPTLKSPPTLLLYNKHFSRQHNDISYKRG